MSFQLGQQLYLQSITNMKQIKKAVQPEILTSTHLVSRVITQNNLIHDQEYASCEGAEKLSDTKRQKISQYIGDKLKNSTNLMGSHMYGSTNAISRIGDHSQINNKSQLKWQLISIEQQLYHHKGLEKFMISFAKNPQAAIQEIKTKNQIGKDYKDLAVFLVSLEGLSKTALGEYFGTDKLENKEVLKQYCKLLRFESMQFDKAMRLLLSKFKLPGEAQQIERILLVFSQVYYQSHKIQFSNPGQIHVLSYSLIMLNTDAHSSHQRDKMTKQQFIKNTTPCCPGISKNYLSGMYDRVTNQQFQTETNFIQKIYDRLNMLKVNLTGQKVAEILKQSMELVKGHIFIKYCLDTVKSVQRKIFLSDDQKLLMWVDPNKENDTPRSLKLQDLVDITLGCNSMVMKKNKVPKQFDSMCFSMQFTTRTLDLKARDPDHRARWVNYLRALLIKKRNETRQRRQQFIKTQINRANIQEIWNNDIFPHWDDHWDYRFKKPKEQKTIKTFFKKILCCNWFWRQKDQVNGTQVQNHLLHQSKNPLLITLWKYGLPEGSRKTLWPLMIGNNLKINQQLYQIYEDKRKSILEIQKMPYSHDAISIVELFETVRPDIGLIRNLLQLAEVFLKYMEPYTAFACFANMIHRYHFLTFFQGELQQIDLRLKFFDYLMQLNCPVVNTNLKALEVYSKLFMVNWFLSVFSTSFQGQFLARIWDNFLLEGQVYLFKVGIAIIKYFQFQLKMCTFEEAIRLLSYPKQVSQIIFFEILQQNVKCQKVWFSDYIQKRNDAFVKTKVQEIPLQ